MVKAFPNAVIGIAQLKVLNEASDCQVIVKKILVGPPGDGPKHQAIAQEFQLAPAQQKTVDLTATIVKLLGANGKGPIEVFMQIGPEPQAQPGASTYFCQTANGRVVEFRLLAPAAD